VKTLLRWVSNALAFYLALYLVDSVVNGRFKIGAVWVAVILAVVLGLLNSLIRPLYRVKAKPGLAISEAVLTVLLNALVLQIMIWATAPLSVTNVVWIFIVAAFLALLGGVINWLIGFKKKEKPGATTQERRAARDQDATREQKAPRETKAKRRRRAAPETKPTDS
jgi:putative membrane protein